MAMQTSNSTASHTPESKSHQQIAAMTAGKRISSTNKSETPQVKCEQPLNQLVMASEQVSHMREKIRLRSFALLTEE
jgi:hypothetical protein